MGVKGSAVESCMRRLEKPMRSSGRRRTARGLRIRRSYTSGSHSPVWYFSRSSRE